MMRAKSIPIFLILILGINWMSGCNAPGQTTITSPQPTPEADSANLPQIISAEPDRNTLPRYESLEFTVTVQAEYTNPFDMREVKLDGMFTAPDGSQMNVPGFWDGEEAWRVRFTPSQEGAWQYQLIIQDKHGASLPASGNFEVTPSELHGWVLPGSSVNRAYSPRYLVYHDGTPFYGVGHCDALNLLADGFDPETGFGIFDEMKAVGENYVVWWPLYAISPINNDYARYNTANLKMIDLVVQDAQKKGVLLVFTIWDHPELRAAGHAWGAGKWESNNGFRKLGSIDSFFTNEEAWAWQENFYRYTIARWGYSPAILMWQLVSEINGTNAYNQTDAWHAKINTFFVENDPYRHPTTASKSGDVEWFKGFAVTDASQVHVYDLDKKPIESAKTIAYWTSLMWQAEAKPNWIGEFGVPDGSYYPELFHNAIWAALASGAAMTPAEWNDRGNWARMTPEMNADIARLAQFVDGLPLAELNPLPLEVMSSDPTVRGWGVAGKDGGLFWVQDFSLEGKTIKEVRELQTPHAGAFVDLVGLAEGTYTITPYDTWKGEIREQFDITCVNDQSCRVLLPDFTADMAFKITRR